VLVLDHQGHRLTRVDTAHGSVLAQLELPQALTAELMPGADGRHAWGATADGGLMAVDLSTGATALDALAVRGPFRLVLSSDQRWLLAVSDRARQLLLLDPALRLVRAWPLPGVVAWLADAAGRRSFVLAFADRPELWELSYDERAEDFYDGLVHDYRMGEGVPTRGFHNPRRMPLAEPLLDVSFDAECSELAGRAQVFNLDARRVAARRPALQPPGPGAGCLFRHQDRWLMALPVGGQARVDVWRTGDWTRLVRLPTAGAGRAVRSHPRCATLVADALLAGAPSDQLTLIDGASLQPMRDVSLCGPLLAPPVFAADGQRLFAAVGGDGGGLCLVDTRSGQVQRLDGWTGLVAVRRPGP
jgi:hypothetical protein